VTYSNVASDCQNGQSVTLYVRTRSLPLGTATANFYLTMTFFGYYLPDMTSIASVNPAQNTSTYMESGWGTDAWWWNGTNTYTQAPTATQTLSIFPGYESATLNAVVTSQTCPSFFDPPGSQTGSTRTFTYGTQHCERSQAAVETENVSAINDITTRYTAVYNSQAVAGQLDSDLSAAPPRLRWVWGSGPTDGATISTPTAIYDPNPPFNWTGSNHYSGQLTIFGGRYDRPGVWWGLLQGNGWMFHGYGEGSSGVNGGIPWFSAVTSSFRQGVFSGIIFGASSPTSYLNCGLGWGGTILLYTWRDVTGAEYGGFGLGTGCASA
jgi:hypothetical protein